jgi:hypothetical protein
MTSITPPVLPHSPLTAVVGKPTPPTVALLDEQLYANAHASKLGGDPVFGLLSTIMTPAEYAALPVNPPPFVPPVHPGPNPVHALGATQAQITETNRAHLAAERVFEAYTNGTAQLKNQVLTAVDNTFLAQLSVQRTGYTDVTLATIMAHLRTRYGIITGDMLQANLDKLNSEFTPGDSMDSLWLRIKECRELVAAVDPITEMMAMTAMMKVLTKTGVFTVGCKDWRTAHPTVATWTLALFQPFFDLANDERVRNLTTSGAGYHGANAAGGTPPPAAAGGRPRVLVDGTSTWYYCWSHGLCKNPEHTSMGCLNKKDNHKKEATIDHMMGCTNSKIQIFL